VALSTVLQ